MLITDTRTYVHILPQIISNYNNTAHDTISTAPILLHNTINHQTIESAKSKIKKIY
jgi:hypothetical protein